MYAVRSIKFLNKQSVCRGGVLKAGEFINASVVGSEAGANNVLEVFGKKRNSNYRKISIIGRFI